MTKRTYQDAWVCVDCYFAHEYGYKEHEGQFYAGDSDTPADREPLTLLDRSETANNVDANDLEDSGEIEFSWSRCDGCGSTLGGSRHRLAVFEGKVMGR